MTYKKIAPKIGEKYPLKSFEYSPLPPQEEDELEMGTKENCFRGFYLGKKDFHIDKNDEVIGPEFIKEKSRGTELFYLFVNDYKEGHYIIYCRPAYLGINLRKKFIEVSDFPTEFFLSNLEERINYWKKQNKQKKNKLEVI